MKKPLVNFSEEALARLKRKHRTHTVLLSLAEGHSVREVAARMGLTRQAVYKIAHQHQKTGKIASGQDEAPSLLAEAHDAPPPLSPPKLKHPTLAQVAQKAGVSTATASRALRNLDSLRLSTKIKVKRAAEELGYSPHPYVSTLMRQVRERAVHPISAELAWLHAGCT